MLIEDIYQDLIPNPRYNSKAKTLIRLEPSNDAVQAMLLKGLGHSGRDARALDEAVGQFVESTAQMIAYYGESFYEIVYYISEDSVYQSFALELIPNWTLRRGALAYTQRQPLEWIDRNEPIRTRRVRIPNKSMVHFGIPGGPFAPQRHRRLLRRLNRLSRLEAPVKFMDPGRPQSGFDFSHYQHSKMIHLAYLTKSLGWHARQAYQTETNEFYQIHRYLKFELWRARLRESIVSELNEALRRAGKEMNFQSHIVVEGIPTSSEINHIIADVQNGRIEFSSAMERSRVL
jgi:hypothetical protein